MNDTATATIVASNIEDSKVTTTGAVMKSIDNCNGAEYLTHLSANVGEWGNRNFRVDGKQWEATHPLAGVIEEVGEASESLRIAKHIQLLGRMTHHVLKYDQVIRMEENHEESYKEYLVQFREFVNSDSMEWENRRETYFLTMGAADCLPVLEKNKKETAFQLVCDAVADIVVYLSHFCFNYAIDFGGVVHNVWTNIVRKRDWKKIEDAKKNIQK